MANEKRLIDANALIEFIRRNCCDGCNSYDGVKCRACEHDDEILMLEDAPTVDAVEVVRCKDCAFYRETEDWDGNKYYACHKRAAVLIMQMKPDDFCSYGERRTDD